MSFLRVGVSRERAVSLFVVFFLFLIVNLLIERHIAVCCLQLQCCRTPGRTPLNFITNLGLFPLGGLRASDVFVRREKANKFKLNANTVIHTRH